MKKVLFFMVLFPTLVSAGPITVTLPPPAPTSSDWYKLGKPFGPSQAWQFGIDTSKTAGACIGYDLKHSEFLGGTCRDLLLLARRGKTYTSLGAALLWDTNHAHGALVGRLGLHVGQAAAAAAERLSEDLPSLQQTLGWQAPSWLLYLDKITVFDFMGGPRTTGGWAYGPEVKASIPLDDLWALVTKK